MWSRAVPARTRWASYPADRSHARVSTPIPDGVTNDGSRGREVDRPTDIGRVRSKSQVVRCERSAIPAEPQPPTFSDSEAMTVPSRVRLVLDFDLSTDPISGVVVDNDRDGQPFYGWMALTQTIELTLDTARGVRNRQRNPDFPAGVSLIDTREPRPPTSPTPEPLADKAIPPSQRRPSRTFRAPDDLSAERQVAPSQAALADFVATAHRPAHRDPEGTTHVAPQ